MLLHVPVNNGRLILTCKWYYTTRKVWQCSTFKCTRYTLASTCNAYQPCRHRRVKRKIRIPEWLMVSSLSPWNNSHVNKLMSTIAKIGIKAMQPINGDPNHPKSSKGHFLGKIQHCWKLVLSPLQMEQNYYPARSTGRKCWIWKINGNAWCILKIRSCFQKSTDGFWRIRDQNVMTLLF